MIGLAASALAYAWLGASVARARPGGGGRPQRSWWLMTVVAAATAVWALLGAADRLTTNATPAFASGAFDVARYAAWFGFLATLLRAGQPSRSAGGRALARAAIVVAALAAAAWAWRARLGLHHIDDFRPALATMLACSVVGLVLVEQLFRNLDDDARWGAKPLCLGAALIFAFDVYLFSDALLLGRLDADAVSARGLVTALAVPLLLMSARRRGDWIQRLQVSRALAFHSATLLLIGTYLLFMSAVGYYVRYFGGDWGRALQIAVLAAAVGFLVMVTMSGALRSRVKVFVGKHFFRYRYDYRDEWLRFTRLLGSTHAPQEVGALVVRGLAQLVECPGGDLWMRVRGEPVFRQAARWNTTAIGTAEPADSPFGGFLAEHGWVIDLHEYKQSPRQYGDLAIPSWLLAQGEAWLVVPLVSGEALLGFVTLQRARAPTELDWEVRDLLKTAAQQAAGHLAQMQATEELLEARKFDAFNRMSAFVVHDLKNIVTQLSLMAKNAQRLHANPEFQQDMLLTVESSLEKMRRLMLQLREGATPSGVSHGVDLPPILRKLQALAEARGRELEIQCEQPLATRGHEERLERVIGHLVHNALDATEQGGRVWVSAERRSGQVYVEVGDTGTGMDEDFVRERLFRPFHTTKAGGMGIGSYESQQYIHELGGSMTVDSRPGEGTVMRIVLPLFVSAPASDLVASR